MTRIIGNTILTFEDMNTVFAQVEAVLNSRPLTPLSSDPRDLLALTPGHFLIGDSLKALPQRDVAEQLSNRLDRYHLLQKLNQEFWLRWSAEYLSLLQQRIKWQDSSDNIKLGAMVVVKDENMAPLCWKLGRIVALHPGKDELIRIVSVRTSTGTIKRSVQKVCVLPVETFDTSLEPGNNTL